MEAFISRKRRKLSSEAQVEPCEAQSTLVDNDDDSTDLKLGTLASLYPDVDQSTLLDFLINEEGSVQAAARALSGPGSESSPRKRPNTSGIGYQASLSSFRLYHGDAPGILPKAAKTLTRKGQTLHLYAPEDIATHTPCSIIQNFLPPQEAEDLLKELLQEATSFGKQTFKLFDNVVQSPHSACFYVESLEEQNRQKTEYVYNGSYLTDVRQLTPHMRAVSSKVQKAVNEEIAIRIKSFYPGGVKLKYQSPGEWVPNAAFANCYNGGADSVGYHSDQLTYLGPRAVIGSLSLGVPREFRVRKIVARESSEEFGAKEQKKDKRNADAQGQIAIHLPHNSLLVMHAEMQEEWKHSIHPAQAIDPHPVAGNKRINITYRHYRESFHPRYTPRCRCGIATVLRCVQRKNENRGRYMWMCHAGITPGNEGCTFFQWAEFDDNGEPPWVKKERPI